MVRLLTLGCCLALLLALPARAQEEKEPEIITRLKKAKVDGPFTLIVAVKVKEGKEKEFLEAAKPCVTATRKEKGCLAYEVHQDLEDSTKFVFYERWKSVKDLAAHFEEEHLKKLIKAIPEFLDGHPKFAIAKQAQ